MSIDTDAAESTARTVSRLLAGGDIETVWSMLHVDYRTAIVDEVMGTSFGREMLAAPGPRLHGAMFCNLARQRLLNAVGPLPWAEAERRVHSVALFAAGDSVVVTLDVDGEPDCCWEIEMTLTDGRWLWHNVAASDSALEALERRGPLRGEVQSAPTRASSWDATSEARPPDRPRGPLRA